MATLSLCQRPLAALLIATLLSAAAACTKAPVRPSASPFINRGPMAVSSDNPHLGTNRYLQDYSAVDLNLKGFLDHEGLPDALELKTLSGQPLQMFLYYIEANKSYRLLENDPGWTVFSAEPFDRNILKALAGVSSLRAKFPELEKHKSLQAKPDTRKIGETQDIIHTVGELGETLQTIAKKYTGATEVVGTLARINSIDPIAILEVGTVVRIPSYLATKQHRAPKKELVKPPAPRKPSAVE